MELLFTFLLVNGLIGAPDTPLVGGGVRKEDLSWGWGGDVSSFHPAGAGVHDY